MNETKKNAQHAIADAALAIGKDGGTEMVFCVSTVDVNEDQARTSIAMVGEQNTMVNALARAMQDDQDVKTVILKAASTFMKNKMFGRGNGCNCPACKSKRDQERHN